MQKPRVSIIAAIGKNRELGHRGELIWRLPDDQRHFRELTSGHPVIMGRKTWESLPDRFRPLPGRTNIVVTRQAAYPAPGALVTSSLEAARALAAQSPGAEEVFILGGGELYREALPEAGRLYLTLFDATAAGADTYFPAYAADFTTVIADEPGEGEPPHRFLTLERA